MFLVQLTTTTVRFIKPNCVIVGLTFSNWVINYDSGYEFAAYRNGVLTKYDYVLPSENYRHYGQPSPPVYNLVNIPHDISLFLSYGGKYALSDVVDVQILLDILKFHDADKLTVQFIKEYAHADFVMGINAKDICSFIFQPSHLINRELRLKCLD
ncbi:hypothetical protein Lal_00002639 [Lupinus albus]|uniref:Putative triacylglycerol lipase n=1 Tax=Lupinus albus TaxID=3870 RepID=A0A6A4PBA1_LUPAL|nr:putative triacylglycerol lipase [Lupinus albus]KAF1885740.1 hypothetical protein Lal_00002639 [Lupinus albus]